MSAQEHPGPESDIAGRKGSKPSPAAEMSAGEKVAAQWEARHDVAARGGRLDPLAVQHYLSHSRTEEMQRTGLAGGQQHGTPPATAPVPGGHAHRGAEGTSSGEDPRGQRRRRGRLLWWRRR